MTLYVKDFEIDRRKIADILEVTSTTDPLVEAAIHVVVEWLNRDTYLKIVTGYEPPDSDGNCLLALVIALEIDDDAEKLMKKELGSLDDTGWLKCYITLVFCWITVIS